jgi:replicative DNA helicase Mcm
MTHESSPIDHNDLPGVTDELREFLEANYRDEIEQIAQQYPKRQRLYIDYAKLDGFDASLASRVREAPDEMRRTAEYVLQRMGTADAPFDHVHPCIYNLPDITPVSELSAEKVGTLVSIAGTVSSAATVVGRPTRAGFTCERCGTTAHTATSPRLPIEDIEPPRTPDTCRDDGFLTFDTDESELVDYQAAAIEGGEFDSVSTETVSAVATRDLAGMFTPGERLVLAGVLRWDPAEDDNSTSLSDRYLDVHHIGTEVSDPSRGVESSHDEETNWPAAVDRVAETIGAEVDGPFSPETLLTGLIEHFASSVPGHGPLKRALLFQLAGGVSRSLADGTRRRGAIHLLVVSDRGSLDRLLDATNRVAPRSVRLRTESPEEYEPIAAVTHDGRGQWRIHSGSLLRADRGLFTVQHLGGLHPETQRILADVMEHQRGSIMVGGARRVFQTDASVLAFGSPKYGRFDEYEPISEQLDFDAELLSAFDLIYVVEDRPDREVDRQAVRQQLAVLSGGEPAGVETQNDDDEPADGRSSGLTPEILRRYLAHVRACYEPRLTTDARDHIEAFYADKRSQDASSESFPVSDFELDTVLRLAEASARLRRSDHVTEADAEVATETFDQMLQSLGHSSVESLDADVVQVGTSATQRDHARTVQSIIDELEGEYDAGAPYSEVVEYATEQGLPVEATEQEIEHLKQRGEVYEPAEGYLRTT